MSDKEKFGLSTLLAEMGINISSYDAVSLDMLLKAMLVKELKEHNKQLKTHNDGLVFIQNHLADICDMLLEIKEEMRYLR